MDRALMQMAVVLLGVLAMAQQTMQHSLKNPLPFKTPQVKAAETTATYGIVTTLSSAEKALNKTGLFNITSSTTIAGRTFFIGTIYSATVVYVRCSGDPAINVAITVQILADNFNVSGIIHFGIAGASNNTLVLGSVVIPSQIGYTGLWTWLDKDVNGTGPQFSVKDYNVEPTGGDNLLGTVVFTKSDIYYKGDVYTNYFIYASDSYLTAAASVEIATGSVVVGLNGSSSDIYVKNPAYREILYKTFRVSTLDTASAAVGFGAKSNGLHFISLVGVSNYAGHGTQTATNLANRNVAKALANLIYQLTATTSSEVSDL